jgi:hypothetical protein
MAECQFPPLEATSSVSNVTSQWSDHGFLRCSMGNTYFEFIVYRSQVKRIFSFTKKGGLSVSIARGRLEPDATSPFDSSATVSNYCSTHITCLARTIQYLYPLLDCRLWRIVEFVRWGRWIPEMTSPNERMTMAFY